MSITIEVDAKKILVKENCMPKLMGLLHDRNDAVVLNTIKVPRFIIDPVGDCELLRRLPRPLPATFLFG
jgi:hypothetical protein